ncbi:MAG TPA: sugar phosphate isomerase/epimerase [Bryobacteraceae bacterium]|jgi:2-keto-myo-inositol isomerase|nr:sugar phosphate isomerase/epimerase [Bryobacteraceae bacterium]
MLSRRTILATSVAGAVAGMTSKATAATGKMTLCMHQGTSRAAGYRKSLEGWAKAGIKNVELSDTMLDDFLKTDSLEAAGRVFKDLGLNAVSSQAVLPDVWIPGPARAASLETWKKRCDQFSTLGLPRIYCPSVTNRRVTKDDFKATPDCIRESGEIAKQHNITAMIEFARTSTHLATLTSSLKVIREAGHPNVKPMMDFFHFWSGLSKFEDLDLFQQGELVHAHFQDVADVPKELYDNSSRLIPGDGISPLVKILRKLAEKGYAGSLSVELFLPELQNGDPYETAKQIKEKSEAVMRKARVA